MPSDIDELLDYLRYLQDGAICRLQSLPALDLSVNSERCRCTLERDSFARWIAAVEELRTLRAGDVVTLPACQGTITNLADTSEANVITPIVIEADDGDPTES